MYPAGPRYNPQKLIQALRHILSRLPGHKRIVVVDNAWPDSRYARELGPDDFEISGDNRYREFSGWQKGIEFLRGQATSTDVWLLANDTFLTQSRIQRFAFRRDALNCAVRHDAIVGKRMTLPAGAEIMGNPLIPYVRTHLFHLSSSIMERLGSVVSLDAGTIDRLLLSEFDPSTPLFRKDGPISEVARQVIFSHLTKDWYRRKPYTADHFEDLRGKAISLVNSFLLSLRIHQLGYPLISYTKAAAFLDDRVTLERIRRAWLGGFQSMPAPAQERVSGIWGVPHDFYRHIPPRKRALTMSSLLELLESRPGREHM
jgi:hypothetical protein